MEEIRMKPSLDRTVVLSKDLTEQPECPYIVLFPDNGMVISADLVTHEEGEIQIMAGGKIVASFSPDITWMCVEKTVVDVVTRRHQMERMAENMKEEKELWKTLAPLEPDLPSAATQEVNRPTGQYL